MILGGSGFIGRGLYKELAPYYHVHATYNQSHSAYEANHNYHQWNVETEPLEYILRNLKPDLIISAFRGNFEAQLHAHYELMTYVSSAKNRKMIFLSSANVFDEFTNYPSYEYDKTFSTSIYGRFKIQIENALLRMPNENYNILRIPMIFGANSPRIKEIQTHHKVNDPIEVFPNVVINATTLLKLLQQIHYIINRDLPGVFHLGSVDLIHHKDLILEICDKLTLDDIRITQVYESNDDRYLAILPRDNPLPNHLNITVQEVINRSVL